MVGAGEGGTRSKELAERPLRWMVVQDVHCPRVMSGFGEDGEWGLNSSVCTIF